jgi:hypothetical protein
MATCSQQVKDAKTGEMRNCKVAPAQGSDKCKRHGGGTSAPAAAPATAPKATEAPQATQTKATGGVAICKATVKSTGKPCGNKATKGDFCGRHGTKDVKAPPVSKDGTGYPTNCKKTTGKHVACKNNAYGPDSAGVPSCSRHGGPKKETGTASASVTGGGNTAQTNSVAKIPILHIAAVIGTHLLKQVNPENVAENDDNGFGPEFEACNWLVQWFAMHDGKTPEEEEIVHQLVGLKSTSEGEDFLEHFQNEDGDSHSMVFYIEQLLGKENTVWLVDYIRKYASNAGAEELDDFWQEVKEELGFPDVQQPIANEQPIAKSVENPSQKKFLQTRNRVINRANEIAAAAEKAVEKPAEEQKEEDEIMA